MFQVHQKEIQLQMHINYMYIYIYNIKIYIIFRLFSIIGYYKIDYSFLHYTVNLCCLLRICFLKLEI